MVTTGGWFIIVLPTLVFFFCNFVDDIVGIINIYMEDYGRILRTFNGSMIKLFLAENKPPKFDINIFPKHLGGITHVQT